MGTNDRTNDGETTDDDVITGGRYLREEQYADEANLAARQAIYRFAEPGPNIFDVTLDALALAGDERIVDVGCGNGLWHAALAARGHRGAVVGADLSDGMLLAARGWNVAQMVQADAVALPVRSGSADGAFAMHMLYHVADKTQALTELGRALRPGGVVAVTTNGRAHIAELDTITEQALGDVTGESVEAVGGRLGFYVDDGAPLLEGVFDNVTTHWVRGRLAVDDPDVVAGYVASMIPVLAALDATGVAAVRDRALAIAEERIARDGVVAVTTESGAFLAQARGTSAS